MPAALLVVLTFAFLFITACRTPNAAPLPSPPRPSNPSTPGPIVLRWWHSESGAARLELESLASDFHTAYPDLIVQAEYVGSDAELAKKISAAIAGNNAPELALVDRLTVEQAIRQDGLLPLDKFMTDPQIGFSADDRSDFFPGLLDEGVFADPKRVRTLPTPTPLPPTEPPPDQPLDFNLLIRATPAPTPGPLVLPLTVTYSIPFDASAVGLYSNLDVLNNAKYFAPPRTWADFTRMARESTKGDAYGWAMTPQATIYQALLVANDGRLADEFFRRALLNNAAGLRVAAIISELSKAGAAKYYDNADQARADFLAGRTAFFFAGTNELSSLANALGTSPKKFKWAVSNVPIAEGDNSNPTLLLSRDLVIFRTDSDRARAAWFFIRWLTASHQVARWTRAAGALPLRASALQFLGNDVLTDVRLQQLKENYGVTAPYFIPRQSSKYSPQIDRVIGDLWRTLALSKDTNLQAALDGATIRLTQLLNAP